MQHNFNSTIPAWTSSPTLIGIVLNYSLKVWIFHLWKCTRTKITNVFFIIFEWLMIRKKVQISGKKFKNCLKQSFSEPDVWVKGLIIGAPKLLEIFVKVIFFENFNLSILSRLVSLLGKFSVPIEKFHQVHISIWDQSSVYYFHC